MSEQAPNTGEKTPPNNEAADAVAELKTQMDQMKTDNARLQGRLDQFERMRPARPETPQVQQQAAPQLTPEQYNELWQKNPAEAVKMAVRGVVAEEVKPLVQDVERKSSRERWDEKVSTDFPAMETDADFRRAVEDKVKELVQVDKRSPEDPTLLYRAAELASIRFSKKQTKAGSGGMSGEAPTNTRDDSAAGKYKAPAYFDQFGDVFGLSKESRQRLATKMEKAASQPQRRSR